MTNLCDYCEDDVGAVDDDEEFALHIDSKESVHNDLVSD